MKRDAAFSEDGNYRYWLSRWWNDEPDIFIKHKHALTFIGLNPSKAGKENDDTTIRRVMGFARREGYSGILMLNLFSIVSTDPKLLLTHPDPIGADGDKALRAVGTSEVVFCWGAFPEAQKRAEEVIKMFPHALCLGKTKDGHPRHPCRIANNTPLVPFQDPQKATLEQ